MPIFGAKPSDCFNSFLGAVRPLIAGTVTTLPLICRGKGDSRTLEFASGPAPLDTNYGRLYFHLAQSLAVVPEPGRKRTEKFRLETRQYWYRLQENAAPLGKALIRWEYDKSTARDRNARHHVQIAARVSLGTGGQLDLNKLHTPTGWTTIEEVIRFLICDLGVKPPCENQWPDVLERSERAFYQDFTSKRYDPDQA